MAEIAQRVFAADGTKKFLRLYREELVRPLNLPAWSNSARLRLGLLMSIADAGVTPPDFDSFIGFCAGNSPYTSGSTVHAMGFRLTRLTYTANGGNPFYTPALWSAAKRVNGVTESQSFGTWTSKMTMNSGGPARRGLFIVDVFPWQNVYCLVTPDTQAANDATLSDLTEAMENQATANWYGNAVGASYTSQNFTATASTPLDTLNIFWGSGVVPLEIFGICVYKFNS